MFIKLFLSLDTTRKEQVICFKLETGDQKQLIF